MNRNLTFAVSLAAGLLGGVLSHFIALPSVHAQAPASNPVEIRAQRFTLVDDQGSAIGTFTVRESGPVVQRGPGNPGRNGSALAPVIAPRIVLLNPEGHEIWSAGGTPFRTLAENLK
jgi:hypothetical protein